MVKKELTVLEIHEKLRRRVDYMKKWLWVFRICLLVFTVAFFVALFTGDTSQAIILLFFWMVTLLEIIRHNQHKLILILWDELRTARGLPVDSGEANEGE
ncbi:MAG: hypothetical protein K8R91_01105 [Phycisphaerae bacterium]|nr:hypothetical protein [Phycisphaerae bacterium]